MHRVSDHLRDRLPYLDLPFNESYNAQDVTRAFGSRVIPKYAELLIMDDLADDDRVKALVELQELLSNQELKFQAVDREIMFACADLATASSASVRANTALVMSTLVLYNTEGHTDELSLEAMLRATTTLLEDDDDDVVVAACSVFRNFTISNEGSLVLAARVEIMAKLTSMINSQPLRTIPEGRLQVILETLANVTRVFEGAQTVAECAVTTPVLQVLKKCPLYDARTVHAAARIIHNAGTHDQGKRVAIKQGGVEVLLRVLAKILQVPTGATFQKCDEKLHLELLRVVVGAIMALSTVEEAKSQVVEFGVEPLVACLHHAKRSIRENAAIAINSACESPQGIPAFVVRLLPECELLVEVLGAKCIRALPPYLQGVDEVATAQALRVLWSLCRVPAQGGIDGNDRDTGADRGPREIVQCLHLLEVLVGLLDDPTKEVRDLTLQTLQAFAQHGDTYRRRLGRQLRKHHAPSGDVELILGLDMATFEQEFGGDGGL